MALEWLICAVIIAICSPTFGHFGAVRPLWTRIIRWLAYLAVTGLLGATVGRPWTLIWALGLPLTAGVFHLTSSRRDGFPSDPQMTDGDAKWLRPEVRRGAVTTLSCLPDRAGVGALGACRPALTGY